jgi:hypothetical protein
MIMKTNDVWYVVELNGGPMVGSGTPYYPNQINVPASPYGIKVDYFPGTTPWAVDITFTIGKQFDDGSCHIYWTTGQSSEKGAAAEVHLCKPAQGNKALFACEDPKKVGWNTYNDDNFDLIHERRFNCTFVALRDDQTPQDLCEFLPGPAENGTWY